MELRPIVLEGAHVRLEPLSPEHAADLFAVGSDPEIWTYMPRLPLRSLKDAQAWIDEAAAAVRAGTDLPFAIVARASGRAVGSTRFLDIRRAHRGLEIGWTWVAREHQRTRVNTECKRLLLAHAFEAPDWFGGLGALRVQLKTDLRNLRSQRAIERIGAVREGVLRKHMILTDGFVRDSVLYSITDEQWPAVRARLDRMLEPR